MAPDVFAATSASVAKRCGRNSNCATSAAVDNNTPTKGAAHQNRRTAISVTRTPSGTKNTTFAADSTKPYVTNCGAPPSCNAAIAPFNCDFRPPSTGLGHNTTAAAAAT